MKLVLTLNAEGSWIDNPEVDPAYIFNNMRDCVVYFNNKGTVEVVKEPSPYNLYDTGKVSLTIDVWTPNHIVKKYEYNCYYAQCVK